MLDRPLIPLYLFAKAPVPGRVKTRMCPPLGDRQCAELACLMLEQSVKTVTDYWPGNVILCVTPDASHEAFSDCEKRYQLAVTEQIQGDLGARMGHALQQGLKASSAAVVMGCDVPYIDGEILRDTYHLLENGDNIVGPAEDGGFYLLGMHEFQDALFEGIAWGSDTVLPSLLDNAARLGQSIIKVETLRDIDRWPDLVWLAGHDSAYRHFINDAGPFNTNLLLCAEA